ncbi:2,3-bisphosphoglycerate-independent phosphoglycerate mutase [Folsomia candida]|uniref:2,3-bisphosphoglycerate-independent phosphoglycerate mutase n=1 Tax=Folsomia candida TaxID=158441 RepID=A0A226CWI3_FOLCA|nr:2,3-bisphosphoglycerate-independent phosphoglycerate mutase [Folsomia candida]
MDCTTINSDIGDGPSAFQTPPENSIATVEKNFKVGGTSNGGNAIRMGQERRLKELFKVASLRNYVLADFADMRKLQALEPPNSKQEHIRKAVGRLSSLSLQKFARTELQKYYNVQDAYQICSHLVHFSCLKKYGKQKLERSPAIFFIYRAASPGVHEKPVPPKFCLG